MHILNSSCFRADRKPAETVLGGNRRELPDSLPLFKTGVEQHIVAPVKLTTIHKVGLGGFWKLVSAKIGSVSAKSGVLPAGATAETPTIKPTCDADVLIRVSVIVPAYRNAGELSQCISALSAAAPPDTELIVVDDASEDGVSSTAANLGARVLRLARNAGPAAARNHGARHARGQILFFVDSDVVVPDSAIGRIRTTLDWHGEIAAVFGSYDARPAAPGLVSQYRNLLHHFVHQTTLLHGSVGLSVLGRVALRTILRSVSGISRLAGLGCSPPKPIRAANLAEQSQMGGCYPPIHNP